MVETNPFQFIVRTPHEVALDSFVKSVRVLTETGHVGLRPRMEPTVLAVEAGVVHARLLAADPHPKMFIGTAGGLLMCDCNAATLLTPLAVVGENEDSIVRQIDDLMQQSTSEFEARATLSKLEGHILSELRREQKEGVAQKLEQLH